MAYSHGGGSPISNFLGARVWWNRLSFADVAYAVVTRRRSYALMQRRLVGPYVLEYAAHALLLLLCYNYRNGVVNRH